MREYIRQCMPFFVAAFLSSACLNAQTSTGESDLAEKLFGKGANGKGTKKVDLGPAELTPTVLKQPGRSDPITGINIDPTTRYLPGFKTNLKVTDNQSMEWRYHSQINILNDPEHNAFAYNRGMDQTSLNYSLNYGRSYFGITETYAWTPGFENNPDLAGSAQWSRTSYYAAGYKLDKTNFFLNWKTKHEAWAEARGMRGDFDYFDPQRPRQRNFNAFELNNYSLNLNAKENKNPGMPYDGRLIETGMQRKWTPRLLWTSVVHGQEHNETAGSSNFDAGHPQHLDAISFKNALRYDLSPGWTNIQLSNNRLWDLQAANTGPAPETVVWGMQVGQRLTSNWQANVGTLYGTQERVEKPMLEHYGAMVNSNYALRPDSKIFWQYDYKRVEEVGSTAPQPGVKTLRVGINFQW